MYAHAEWKDCLPTNAPSSLTVIRVACAQGGTGIQCVVRTGSPTCPHVWLAAPPPLARAETRLVTHHCLHDIVSGLCNNTV